jgi:hypothetical protein
MIIWRHKGKLIYYYISLHTCSLYTNNMCEEDTTYYLFDIDDIKKIEEYVNILCTICNCTDAKIVATNKTAYKDIYYREGHLDNQSLYQGAQKRIMDRVYKEQENGKKQGNDSLLILVRGKAGSRMMHELPVANDGVYSYGIFDDEYYLEEINIFEKYSKIILPVLEYIKYQQKRDYHISSLHVDVEIDDRDLLLFVEFINKIHSVTRLIYFKNEKTIHFTIDNGPIYILRNNSFGILPLCNFDIDKGFHVPDYAKNNYIAPGYTRCFEEWVKNGRNGPVLRQY